MQTKDQSELLDYLKNNRFVNYLGKTLDLHEAELPMEGEWSQMGNTMGALALRLYALNLDQVDEILDVQEHSPEKKRFGEVAVDLGYLTSEQVYRLLEFQDLIRHIELAARMTLTGQLDLPDLVRHLHDYLDQHKTPCA